MAPVNATPKKTPESHHEARQATLRMAAVWLQLGQRMVTAAAHSETDEDMRKLGTEALQQLTLTRDVVAAVMGALPDGAAPRVILAEMRGMLAASAEEGRRRDEVHVRELTRVLSFQTEALELLHAKIGGK